MRIGNPEDFGKRTLQEASKYVGAPYERVPKNTERPLEEGVGPGFNCSGLCVRALAEAAGADVSDWDPTLRFSEDFFWAAKRELGIIDSTKGFDPKEIMPGDIIVWRNKRPYIDVVEHSAIGTGSLGRSGRSPTILHTSGTVEGGRVKYADFRLEPPESLPQPYRIPGAAIAVMGLRHHIKRSEFDRLMSQLAT